MKAMMGEKNETKEVEKPQQLLSRSGSDPQFDNIAYLSKVEKQTLEALKAQGIEVDLSDLIKNKC